MRKIFKVEDKSHSNFSYQFFPILFELPVLKDNILKVESIVRKDSFDLVFLLIFEFNDSIGFVV
jgi:hypothetical protein